jgi:hypothetical protein
MRVIVEANNEKKQFFSMKEAMKHYEYKSYKKFAQEMTFKRIYEKGHWDTVELDFLKMITVRKYAFAD